MITTISNIGKEVNQIISSSKSIPVELSNEEKINRFLDGINDFKTKLAHRTAKIQKLDELLSQATWFDIQNKEEEELLKSVIHKSHTFHSKAIRNFVQLKNNLWKDNICRAEITQYKNALDDFEESIYEINEIFFDLRKDHDFNKLIDSI